MSSLRYKDGSEVQEETRQWADDHLPSLLPPPRYLLRHHPLQGFLLRGRRHREPDRDAGLHHTFHQVDHFFTLYVLTLFPPVWWRSCPPHPTSDWLISGWSMVSWFRSWRSSYSPSWNWRERESPASITTALWGWLKFVICHYIYVKTVTPMTRSWLLFLLLPWSDPGSCEIMKSFLEKSVRVGLRTRSLRLGKLRSFWDVWRLLKK